MQYRNSEETHSFVKKYFFGRQCIAERRSIISYSNVICTLLGPRNDHGGLKILKAWAMPSPFRCSEILGFFRPLFSFPFGNKCTEQSHIFSSYKQSRNSPSWNEKARGPHREKLQFCTIFFIIMDVECSSSFVALYVRSLVRVPQGKGEGPSTKIGYLSFIEFPFEVFVKGDSHCDRSSKVMGYLLRQKGESGDLSEIGRRVRTT